MNIDRSYDKIRFAKFWNILAQYPFFEDIADYWELELLAILPAYQRKGLGSQLLKWGMKQASLYQMPVVVAATFSGKHLYHKHGFEECGRIDFEESTFSWTAMVWTPTYGTWRYAIRVGIPHSSTVHALHTSKAQPYAQMLCLYHMTFTEGSPDPLATLKMFSFYWILTSEAQSDEDHQLVADYRTQSTTEQPARCLSTHSQHVQRRISQHLTTWREFDPVFLDDTPLHNIHENDIRHVACSTTNKGTPYLSFYKCRTKDSASGREQATWHLSDVFHVVVCLLCLVTYIRLHEEKQHLELDRAHAQSRIFADSLCLEAIGTRFWYHSSNEIEKLRKWHKNSRALRINVGIKNAACVV